MFIIHRIARYARPLIWLALMLIVPVALAQSTPPTTIVNYVDFREESSDGSSQSLDTYFTLLNPNGQVLTDVVPEDGFLLLDDGRRIEDVTIARPSNAIFVALVFDASGSMRDAVDEMKQAAIDAVNNAPPEAAFGVYQFNEAPAEGIGVLQTLQGFVTDRALIFDAINRVTIENRGTCLYDATVEAMNALKLVPPTFRRAVLMFTDGRDELVAGGELDPCSQNELNDVLTAATAPGQQTPIYAIGLQGNSPVATRELEDIAGRSGGIARFGDLAALPGLFQEIMRALSSQLLASAPVCIPRGAHGASLYLTVARAQLQPIGVSFNVVNGCIEPTATPTETPTPNPTATNTPEPLVLLVESFAYEQSAELATFIIARDGDGQVQTYRIVIDDAQRGNNLQTFDVDADPAGSERQLVPFETGGLPDASLDIVVIALDAAGNTLARSQPRRAAIVRPTATATTTPSPSPTLSPVDVQVDAVRYDEDADIVSLDLTIAQPQRIEEIQVAIIIDSSNRTIATFTFAPPLPNTLDIDFTSFPAIPNVEYRIRVTARTTDSTRTEPREVAFAYEKPFTPTPIPTQPPSATPTPVPTDTPEPTATLIPVQIEIIGMTPSADWTTLAVRLRLQGRERIIDDLEVRLFDESGFSAATLSQPIGDELFIPLTRLTPNQEYRLVIVAQVLNEPPARGEDQFTFLPPQTPTATFTSTPTVTPLPTATTAPGAVVSGVQMSPDGAELALEISASNTPMIDSFRVRVIDGNGLVVRDVTRKAPPFDSLSLPISGLAPGEYTIELSILNIGGSVLSQSSVPVGYNPPPTPTPTPAPNPIMMFVQNVSTTARTNPPVIIVIAIVFLLLLFVLIWAIRRLTRRRGGSGYRGGQIDDEPTQPFNAPGIPSSSGSGVSTGGALRDFGSIGGLTDSTRPPIDDRTKVDMEATKVEFAPFAGGMPANVRARLKITASDDRTMLEREVAIDVPKFRIGRQFGNLVMRGDEFISREHAEINYENGEFTLTDLNSAGGTFVNDQRLPTGGNVKLDNNARIQLGTRTKMVFMLDS